MRTFSVAILVLPVLLLAGCGSAGMHVETIHPDVALVAGIPGSAESASIAVGDFEIADPVLEYGIVGEAKTGLLNDSTDIICERSVALILADAFREAIYGAGFPEVALEDADYTLQGTIEQVWVEEHATGHLPEYAKAYVKFDTVLCNANGKEIWGHSVDIFKVSEDCFDATEFNIPTLSAALKQGVEEVLTNEIMWQAMDVPTLADVP